jgi:hypothetical protein
MDTQNLWQLLERNPLLGIIFTFAMLAKVPILPGQQLGRAVLS